MNILKRARNFFVGLFKKAPKVVTFPQEEEQDMFIGV
jgi:hypothetical protein